MTSEETVVYRLPRTREYRLLRDITWQQVVFAIGMLAVAIACLVAGLLIAALCVALVGTLGAIGYGRGPGYLYPLLFWHAILHNARGGAIHNEKDRREVIPLKPFNFGKFGTNLSLEPEQHISYVEVGPSIHAAAGGTRRAQADRSMISTIVDILSISKDVKGFGFLVGQRPCDPRRAQKRFQEGTIRNYVGQYPPESIAALYKSNHGLYMEKMQQIISGELVVSDEEMAMIWEVNGDAQWEELSDEASEYYRLIYFVVDSADAWEGMADDIEKYNPATLRTSVLQRAVTMAENLFPQSGFPQAKVLDFAEVCDLDFRVSHVHTLAEAELEQVAASYDEHLDEDGNINVWPDYVRSIGDLLDTDGSFSAYKVIKSNLFSEVEPGGLDYLLMSYNNPSRFFVNVRCYLASTKRDQFLLRRQEARNGGLLGLGAPLEGEQATANARNAKYETLDDLTKYGNGMIRWTRTEQISDVSVYGAEEEGVPQNTLSRWRSHKSIRVTSSFLGGELAKLLGA